MPATESAPNTHSINDDDLFANPEVSVNKHVSGKMLFCASKASKICYKSAFLTQKVFEKNVSVYSEGQVPQFIHQITKWSIRKQLS